jgi:putative Holliday junction resolvase
MPYPRLVAIDYGTKRVGLAGTDPLRLFTRPLGTYSAEGALEEIENLRARDGIEQIIVGWPLNQEGEEGSSTRRVEPFLGRLRERFPDLEIVTWDERYTSVRARKKLCAADAWKKAKRNRRIVDAVAAAVILEEYLEQYPEYLR